LYCILPFLQAGQPETVVETHWPVAHPPKTFSLHFKGHFPGEPGLAGVYWSKDDGGGGDSWTTGAI